MSNTPIVPTLNSAVGIISEPQEIVAYLIQMFVTNPGGVVTYMDAQMVSMRELSYAYGNVPATMAGASREQLEAAVRRIYPGQGISVEVTPRDINGYLYALSIDVSVQFNDARRPIIVSGLVSVTEDNQFIINFKAS